MGGEVRAASPALAAGGAAAAGRASAADRAALDAEAANVCSREPCCALYHRAVELIGKRWTGAIILVLMEGPLRFSEVKRLVPQLSDRLLSERLKELEAEGIVERREVDHSPTRVEYALTPKGQALEPVVRALKRWAHAWL
ncbi:winged helix-turn-helix transcriptional regulator [Thermoleophilum album]|uniref:Transcriptional regulator, HxlR family n=1 Tax=Thermoleophilum album TaxID=29539 RepID=A0A1H6G170_THEAL|nr:helix-turn-helix domain-containing protein [Thermoleophilum album]SEH15744.1 transcriptional regulator, HxlR family [Thermoleophilum album]